MKFYKNYFPPFHNFVKKVEPNLISNIHINTPLFWLHLYNEVKKGGFS